MNVFYNGSTGSLGQYFGASLIKLGIKGQALQSRLEDRAALVRELALNQETVVPREPVFLVQMAALVSVTACEEYPSTAFKTNVSDTIETVRTFVRWARQLNAAPVVVYVSTGHVYKEPFQRKPVTEENETAPRSVYARTKLEAEERLKELADQLDIRLLIGRVFGLIAPRQPPHYVLPGLIRRVQARLLANIPGLEYCRDYLDSRDVCDALARLCSMAALKTVHQSVVNICSGKEVSIRRLVEEIIAAMKLDEKQEMLSSLSAGPGRPDDIPWLVGSCARFEEWTGTKPQQISLAQTVESAVHESFQAPSQ
jgi:GDP-4-dehydro-6-deoxy-D-mannose reductase